jgi:putative aminophosphonate oxidoreductase
MSETSTAAAVPPPGGRRSFWLGEALAGDTEPVAPLTADTRADVCIVGGGYTGLWTAIELKTRDPALDVVLIERDVCGGGASGRNAGFMLSMWAKFLSLKKICGDEEALRLGRAFDAAVDEIPALCAAEGIDPLIRKDGWLWTATSAAQTGAWQDTIDALARHDVHPFVTWSPEEVAARAGSKVHRAGVCETHAATLQPALLARGLRRVAARRGVRIHERTPLVALEHGVPAVVRTPEARIRAERVVLAMNAWSVRWAPIRQAVVVVTGDVIMTAPIGEQLERIGLRNGVGISDGRALIDYWRTTPDGRLLYGKGGMSGEFSFGGRVGDEVEGATPMAPLLTERFQRAYPLLADVDIETSWRGPIDRTQSGLPLFWHLGDAGNVHYGVGFSGNGVGPCRVAGRILASLALGQRDEWAGCGLVRAPTRDFPPEPIRWVGSQLLRRALTAADDALDEGRDPPAYARLLARFAPAGVSPFKVDKAGR